MRVVLRELAVLGVAQLERFSIWIFAFISSKPDMGRQSITIRRVDYWLGKDY
jgi:hypothetical protein